MILPELSMDLHDFAGSKGSDLLKQTNKKMKIAEFTSVKDLAIFDICPSCKKKLEVISESKVSVTCKCKASTKATRLKKKSYTCKVEMGVVGDDGDVEYVWATLFSSVLDIIFKERKNIPTKDEIEEFLFAIANID